MKRTTHISTTNKRLTWLFAILSVIFIIAMAVNSTFFQWTFARHQNILSWYIRPLFMIPLCYFAYKRNPFGIAVTIFLLLTSMFWFPEPKITNQTVEEFLIMEKEYLTTNWNLTKILISCLIPISLGSLIIAIWKRSIKVALLIIAFIAIAKTLWSIMEGGKSGTAVIIPAIVGLVLCVVFIYYGFKRFEKRKNNT